MKSLKNVLISFLFGVAMAEPLTCQIQDSFAISQDELGARLHFLSSDLFQGRYPGTPGEQLTTAYLISELESFGVSPGVNKSWFQSVKIVKHRGSTQIQPEARLSGRITRTLEYGRDIGFSNYTDRAYIETGGELIFAGYGINAPMYGWNDFEGCDLKGKIVVVLRGKPSIPDDSTMFKGYRSRFMFSLDKISEMERRGAMGVLFVAPNGSLTKGPVGGFTRLAEDAANSKLLFIGTITDSTLANLLPPGAPNFSYLIKNASRPRFRAIPLEVRLDVHFQTIPTIMTSNNVVGVVRGIDSLLKSEHIVISSHWDAYGIRRPVNGDSIFNGASDDGSGLTLELALARVFAKNPQPRSVIFLFATYEELGLLGAEAFIKYGPLPPKQIIANFNLDEGTELFGRKRDVAPLGIELSTLGNAVKEVANRNGLNVSPYPFPDEGNLIRTDTYAFARNGVPALLMALGLDDENHPAGWTKAKTDEYNKKHYHQRSDEYNEVVLDLTGSLQLAEFTRDLIIAVAKAKERPQWVKGGEFSRRTDFVPLPLNK